MIGTDRLQTPSKERKPQPKYTNNITSLATKKDTKHSIMLYKNKMSINYVLCCYHMSRKKLLSLKSFISFSDLLHRSWILSTGNCFLFFVGIFRLVSLRIWEYMFQERVFIDRFCFCNFRSRRLSNKTWKNWLFSRWCK